MASQWKNAFKCSRCPQSSDERTGCPMWLEELFEEADGTAHVVKGCAPRVQQYTNRWTNRRNLDVAQTVQQLRNELAQTTAALYRVMQTLQSAIEDSEAEEREHARYPLELQH